MATTLEPAATRVSLRGQIFPVMRRHPLPMFFFIALGSSWIYEAIVFGLLHKTSLNPWLGPATFGPTLAAFLTLAVTQGRPGIGRLLRRYVLWRVPLRWYLVALAGPALIVLATLLVSGPAFRMPGPASIGGFAVMFGIIFIAGGPLGEEPGWRGFALPALQRRAGALWGTLALAAFWALWHLPLFVLVPGYDGSGSGLTGIALPFAGLALQLASSAVILTWVFNNTRGSLLLAILLHASFDSFLGLNPNPWLWTAAWMVIAAIVVAATRGRLSYGREKLDL